MLPEISRRCRSCGAAVRAGARFCPQCGEKMESAPGAAPAELGGDAQPESGGRAADPADAPASLDSESAREWVPPTKEFSAFVGSLEGGAAWRGDGAPAAEAPTEPRGADDDSREPRRAAAEAQAVEVAAVEAPAVNTPAADAPAVDARAAEAAAVEAPAVDAGADAGAPGDEGRGRVARVREGTRARVGKMKEEALVVLEEAPDDSGLRFVVAAAALFVVFLFILLLSTTLLR